MKELLLLRHAKAETPIGCRDIERPLAENGRKEAKYVGKLLNKIDFSPDIIISSNAKRALETTIIIAEKLHAPDEKIFPDSAIYDISAENLLEYISKLGDNLNSVILTGHNPTFEQTLSLLLNGSDIHMSTASAALLRSELSCWRDFRKSCRLFFFINPKLVKKH